MVSNGDRAGACAKTFHSFIGDVMQAHNPDALDDHVADEFIDHSPLADLQTSGKDGLKQQFRRLFESFPDIDVHIDVEVASGDLFAWRATHRGHHEKELMGIPASGREFQYTEMHIIRVNEQGKISEHWGVFDGLGLMQQLGVVMGAPLAVPANPPHHEV